MTESYPPFAKAKSAALAIEAQRWVGVRESSRNAGWAVESFQRAVDGKANQEAWCMAFVQFCVKHVDAIGQAMQLGLHKPAVIFASEHCLTVWNKTPAAQRQAKPQLGSVVIWQNHDINGVGLLSGHTGIVIAVGGNGFQTVEGNTGDSGGREGDGVYLKTRSYSGHGMLRVKGFISAW